MSIILMEFNEREPHIAVIYEYNTIISVFAFFLSKVNNRTIIKLEQIAPDKKT